MLHAPLSADALKTTIASLSTLYKNANKEHLEFIQLLEDIVRQNNTDWHNTVYGGACFGLKLIMSKYWVFNPNPCSLFRGLYGSTLYQTLENHVFQVDKGHALPDKHQELIYLASFHEHLAKSEAKHHLTTLNSLLKKVVNEQKEDVEKVLKKPLADEAFCDYFKRLPEKFHAQCPVESKDKPKETPLWQWYIHLIKIINKIDPKKIGEYFREPLYRGFLMIAMKNLESAGINSKEDQVMYTLCQRALSIRSLDDISEQTKNIAYHTVLLFLQRTASKPEIYFDLKQEGLSDAMILQTESSTTTEVTEMKQTNTISSTINNRAKKWVINTISGQLTAHVCETGVRNLFRFGALMAGTCIAGGLGATVAVTLEETFFPTAINQLFANLVPRFAQSACTAYYTVSTLFSGTKDEPRIVLPIQDAIYENADWINALLKLPQDVLPPDTYGWLHEKYAAQAAPATTLTTTLGLGGLGRGT